MIEFIAIIASFLTLGQFFIGCLLKPENIIPSDNRATLIYVILTASNLFWTLYGFASGIMLISACFGVMLLYNVVILYIRMLQKPKVERVPRFVQPRFLRSEKAAKKV